MSEKNIFETMHLSYIFTCKLFVFLRLRLYEKAPLKPSSPTFKCIRHAQVKLLWLLEKESKIKFTAPPKGTA